MIVGSGLIARAFMQVGANDLRSTCFYAAGVANSGCQDEREFQRERDRLNAALDGCRMGDRLVYFSSCSIADPASCDSAYVHHKLRMEDLVRARARYLILRLPQVAGNTPNPHTLLNYLHAHIARSERFHIWGGATRNIIDVDDIVKITLDLIETEGASAETINIANPHSTAMLDIVHALERVLDTRAVFDVLDKGAKVPIDTGRITASIRRCGIRFGNAYLGNIIEKYYGAYNNEMYAFPASLSNRLIVPSGPVWQL
jgi:hypothetical protein